MTIDKNRIRQKLANINGGMTNDFWSPPKQGRAQVRLFAYPHGEDPFLEYYFHFNIGKGGRGSILCPKKNGFGNDCPICDLANEMYASNDPQDADISKKLYARQRFYGTMIDRADETQSPKFWGFSKTLYIKFLTWLQEDDGDNENFLDVNNGLDLLVGIQQAAGKMFPSTEAEPRRKETPLAGSKQEIESILKSVKPAHDIFEPPNLKDVKEKLEEWLAESSDNESEPAAKTVVKGGNTEKKSPRKSSAEELDELFDQELRD